MGSHGSCLHLSDSVPPESRTVKLIRSDGVVKIFHRPVVASELMLEFPKHLICHSDSFYIGQKIPPLSEDEELQLGHKYFLLPQHFFQSVLSFVTVASFASSSLRLAKNIAGIRPFEILKKPGGSLQIRVSDEFISKLIEGENVKDKKEASVKDQPKGKVCTTPALQKDYTQLVGYRSQQWKPKLETIRELEKNRSRFSGAFGIKRRKRVVPKGDQKLQKSETTKQLKDQEKKL